MKVAFSKSYENNHYEIAVEMIFPLSVRAADISVRAHGVEVGHVLLTLRLPDAVLKGWNLGPTEFIETAKEQLFTRHLIAEALALYPQILRRQFE